MSTITTSTQIAAPVQEAFLNRMLSTPVPYVIYGQAAMKFNMPARNGRIAVMRRAERLEPATVPIGNSGLPKPAAVPNVTDIRAEIQFYGNFILLEEQVVLQDQSPVLNWNTELLAINLQETEDILIRNELQASAGAVNAVAGVSGDTPTEITLKDMNDVTTALFSRNAKTIAQTIYGVDKFGSSPINNAFLAMASTDLQSDLLQTDDFVTTSRYPNANEVLTSEFGQLGYARILMSSNGSVEKNASSLGNDVYDIIVTGMEAYGVITQDQYSSHFRYLPPEVVGGPLAQYGAVSWKKACAQRVLNDSWIARLRVTLRP